MVETAHERHERSALVLYASETGSSQDVAEDLGRIAERLRFVTRVCEMDEVQVDNPRLLARYSIVLFVVSTTGQGEFPRNARSFWRGLLRKRLPPDCLAHVTFTSFGLGDSSYPKFNWAVRKLHKRLEQLGAKEFYPRGEGDEQHQEGIDGTFLPWSLDLRAHLLSSYPLPDGLTPIPQDVLLPPKYPLQLLADSASMSETARNASSRADAVNINAHKPSFFPQSQCQTVTNLTSNDLEDLDSRPGTDSRWDATIENGRKVSSELQGEAEARGPILDMSFPPTARLPIAGSFEAMLVKNERVTPTSHWQDVRLLTFIIPDNYEYDPGDTVTIYPKNFPEDVQALIDLQGWNDTADLPLVLKAQESNPHLAERLPSKPAGLFPLENTTLRQLLTHNLDITAIPKRHFFEIIANQTDDPIHRERLLEFANPAFTDEFFDYATRPRRSILEVLQDFPSVKVPWEWATYLFPFIRGRQFSICTGGIQKAYTEYLGVVKLQLLVALVKYKTVLKKIRQGLCSRYIATLPEKSVIGLTMTHNTAFNKAIHTSANLPVIMVSPGTGVAPCRSLIWQRVTETFENPSRVREAALFFGNRNRAADYFFQDEWKLPALAVRVFTAFSRDQREKIYVQDMVRREGALVHRLIQSGALIVVCGSSGKMPQQVREAFLDVMEQYGGPWGSRREVEEEFGAIEKSGRYLQETW